MVKVNFVEEAEKNNERVCRRAGHGGAKMSIGADKFDLLCKVLLCSESSNLQTLSRSVLGFLYTCWAQVRSEIHVSL